MSRDAGPGRCSKLDSTDDGVNDAGVGVKVFSIQVESWRAEEGAELGVAHPAWGGGTQREDGREKTEMVLAASTSARGRRSGTMGGFVRDLGNPGTIWS